MTHLYAFVVFSQYNGNIHFNHQCFIVIITDAAQINNHDIEHNIQRDNQMCSTVEVQT